MKKVANALAAGVTAAVVTTIVSFAMANWLTDCQSWDRELWTTESSCVTPGEVWRVLRGSLT